MNSPIFRSVLLAATLAVPLSAAAEDIDLFLGLPEGSSTSPNVLIVLDNTGNWGPESRFEEQKEALQAVFESLPDGEINIGLMMYTETGTGDTGPDGAYLRAGIRSMTGPADPNDPTADVGNKARYRAMIGGMDEVVDRSNSGKVGLTMAEAYFYFDGATPYSGNNKNKVDWGGALVDASVGAGLRNTNAYMNSNGSCCSASHPVWAQLENPLLAKDGTQYQSPVDPDSCSKNYIIFIGNGPPSDSRDDNRTAETLLSQAGGDTDIITVSPRATAAANDMKIDEWARFMKVDPLEITTFTLDVNIVQRLSQLDNTANANWSAQLRSAATVSDGEYYDLRGTAFDPDKFEFALNSALSKILSVNTVFASVALPASANTQSTFLNQVFIGMFRPDENVKPRWPGNLKQYRLGLIAGQLKLVDADTRPAIDSGDAGTGFINECARSYWTPQTADNYWASPLTPRGKCLAVANSDVSNYPDGPVVEKGAQAYTRRTSTTRTLYTCNPALATCNTVGMVPFNNTNVSQSALGAADTAERDLLIDWARGLDNQDEDIDSVTTAEMRPSVHGDVIHSRPVAINYGTDANPQVVVFYSGNDGILRAVNGNRTASFNSVAAGHELWAFMPPEFFDDLKRLRANTDLVKFPASGVYAGVTGSPKPYGMDGSMVAFEGNVGGVAKKFLYATMRRGGRALYAFDITDPTSPQLKWKKGCDSSGCDADSDWNDIGETWSSPSVGYAAGYVDNSGSRIPILLMGGGYDECEDFDGGPDAANHSCDASATGRSIYVLDADSGAILNKFTTLRSVVGSVTVVPETDSLSSDMMYAYATDTGGNIYRISGVASGNPAPIGSYDPETSDWILTRIASLGCPDGETDCTANRKFLFGPDVIKVPNTATLGILAGSGDREKPLLGYGAAVSVQNYAFAIFDDPDEPTWLSGGACSDSIGNVLCLDDLTEVATGDDYDPDLAISPKGWRLPLAAEEQVVTGSLTIADVVNFSTHIPAQPSANACESSLGTATTYNLNYADAKGEAINIIGGGLVPTPVAGIVKMDLEDICDAAGNCGLDNREICDADGNCSTGDLDVPFCIGCGGEESSIGGSEESSGITWTQFKSRVYWNIQQ